MFFKSKKAKWFFYISIIVIIIVFILIRDAGYVPQAFSLHMVSEERRGERLAVFEENVEFVEALWERATYYAERGRREEITPDNKGYFFEIYFSDGQNILSEKGRFVVYPDRLIIDGQERRIDARDFFDFCEEVMRSRRSLLSLILDAEFVEAIDYPREEGKILNPATVDELVEKLFDLGDGKRGEAPRVEKTKILLVIPEGEIYLQEDDKLIFSFWGGYWHYQVAEGVTESVWDIVFGT